TTLQNIYDYPIGYSDHTLGATIALASVVKGACIIEKHFTLDKNMFGWDHKVSADSEDLKTICAESKRIYKAMGNKRIYREENDERVVEFRRSIVLTRNMKKGEIITEKDIDFKRPGRGIEPGYANIIIGRKLNKDLKYDDIITFEDFE
ncbi:MAG: N-acetylneuraminate synthase family protein, partial [bacterium]|nr:N-acetylneuraminate synthase family protein [bacterium]